MDGRRVDLRTEYDAARWVPVNNRRVREFSFPLDSGSMLNISGDYVLRIQDNRKFNLPGYSVRLYFTPSKGELTGAEFSAKFELRRLGVQVVDLAPAANMGFADEVAGDGKGGWTDQGPANDLRMLKPGKLTVGGVDFTVADPAGNGGRSAVVLGRKFPHEATVKLSGSGRWLFLLHALAWPGGKKAGALAVTFADGSRQEIPVENGRDVGNWWMPAHFKNATNVWSVENPQCYVGLYLSQFSLKRKDPVRIRLRSGAGAFWMIPAISLGDSRISVEQFDKTVYLVPGREWATLDFPVTVQKGSVLDFSDQLDAPAGKYGPVRISPEGHFVFAQAPERRIRFFGVNLSYGANFPSRVNAEKLAERLAAVGYNVVRFHHQDGGLTGSGDEMFNRENLDRLDYFIAALKKRGIYFMTDLYVSRVRPCYAPLAGAFPVKHY